MEETVCNTVSLIPHLPVSTFDIKPEVLLILTAKASWVTLNQLADVATRELSQQEQPEGFYANKRVAQAGGSVAGNARRDLEQRLGRPVITSANAAQLNHVVTQMIEASASAAADITDEKE